MESVRGSSDHSAGARQGLTETLGGRLGRGQTVSPAESAGGSCRKRGDAHTPRREHALDATSGQEPAHESQIVREETPCRPLQLRKGL